MHFMLLKAKCVFFVQTRLPSMLYQHKLWLNKCKDSRDCLPPWRTPSSFPEYSGNVTVHFHSALLYQQMNYSLIKAKTGKRLFVTLKKFTSFSKYFSYFHFLDSNKSTIHYMLLWTSCFYHVMQQHISEPQTPTVTTIFGSINSQPFDGYSVVWWSLEFLAWEECVFKTRLTPAL